MDEAIYIIGIVMPLLLALLAVLASLDKVGDYMIAGFSAMGGIVGVWVFLGVGSDGDITQQNGASLIPIASGTLNQASWNYITLLPMIFALMAFMAAIYRAWKA